MLGLRSLRQLTLVRSKPTPWIGAAVQALVVARLILFRYGTVPTRYT